MNDESASQVQELLTPTTPIAIPARAIALPLSRTDFFCLPLKAVAVAPRLLALLALFFEFLRSLLDCELCPLLLSQEPRLQTALLGRALGALLPQRTYL